MKNFIIIISILVLSGCNGSDNKPATQWQPWEYDLKAKHKQDGRPSGVEVLFTGPDGQTFRNLAFTDDGIIYRFRAAFPVAGTWNWTTACTDQTDRGLQNKTGQVQVLPYAGDNPLYIHGDIKISENARYLVHNDGTPFLWMGETGWRMTQKSTMEDWQYYINTRKGQRFNVIQISPKGVSKKPESELASISFTPDGKPDLLFWQDLESKIEYANGKGLIIFMVGISKVWSDEFLKNPANQPFEPYITGRLAPYMVIFSPSFDEIFKKGNDSVAVELNKLTSHLVTQHPGTNYQANLSFRNSPSTDFCGMQSGHHGGRLENAYNAARQWTLDMWNGNPVKPVINIEGMYDGYGNNSGKKWREKDVRKIGWISWMSGSKGYTYGAGDVAPKVPKGAGGVWRFNTDSTTYDYWKKAILWPSAGQMTFMHDFFSSVDWWKLEPAHHLVLNQTKIDTLKMVTSLTSDKNLLLAYLPDNPAVKLDLSALSGTFTGKWFNPVNGNYIQLDSPVILKRSVIFKRPEGFEDALLVLKRD